MRPGASTSRCLATVLGVCTGGGAGVGYNQKPSRLGRAERCGARDEELLPLTSERTLSPPLLLPAAAKEEDCSAAASARRRSTASPLCVESWQLSTQALDHTPACDRPCPPAVARGPWLAEAWVVPQPGCRPTAAGAGAAATDAGNAPASGPCAVWWAVGRAQKRPAYPCRRSKARWLAGAWQMQGPAAVCEAASKPSRTADLAGVHAMHSPARGRPMTPLWPLHPAPPTEQCTFCRFGFWGPFLQIRFLEGADRSVTQEP